MLVQGVAALVAVIVLNAFVLSLTLPESIRWTIVGAMIGAAIVGVCWVMHLSFVIHDRAAVYEIRGAWGEDFTRDVLRRALRRRQVWGVVNGLVTQSGDIDHIVVSRRGGLVVIDSKFYTALTSAQREALIEAGRGHRRSMKGLARTVVPRGYGRHRGQEHIPVTTAIVLWGPARHDVPEPQVVDGVHLMSGDDLYAWLKTLTGEPIPKSFGRELTAELRDWAERQRERTAAKANAPAGS